MPKIKKVLVGVFIVFLFIVSGELLYLFLFNKNLNINADKTPYHGPVDPVTYKNLKIKPAIHPNMIDQMKRYIVSPDSSLYMLSQTNTKVLDIIDGEVEVEHVIDKKYLGTNKFPFAMKLENKVLPEGYIWHYYTEEILKRLRVHIVKNGETKPGSIKDIKENDRVVISERWDPSVDPMQNLENLNAQVVDLDIYIYR